MPNWCMNHLDMDKETFEKTKHLFINDDGQIDFRILIPESTSARADIFYDDTRGLLTNDRRVEESKSLYENTTFDTLTPDFFIDCIGEKCLLVKATGWTKKDGWYDWRCDHWGTKWNGGDPDIEEDDDFVLIAFDTAWACPTPFFQALAKYGDFTISGEEESNDFCYEGEAHNGELDISFDDCPSDEEDEEDEEE